MNNPRTAYQGKEFERSTSFAPAWAWGCSACQFGRQRNGDYCTCAAGQARARVAAGVSVFDEDELTVPTVRYVGAG